MKEKAEERKKESLRQSEREGVWKVRERGDRVRVMEGERAKERERSLACD